jgi:pimeloyl-ACP methyl ester carboxylesterase
MMKSIVTWTAFVTSVFSLMPPSSFAHSTSFRLMQGLGVARTHLLAKIDSGNYSQHLDHFDLSDSTTFSQRFAIYNDYSGTGSQDAPVLYYLCGEWACTESQSLSNVPAEIAGYARSLGATIVVVEHRYYGQSKPFSDITPEHMRYLSYNQALEDFAEFERYAVAKYNLKGKWISFGGSYPGALSAFYREKYPDLVVGAYSSSGVVKAEGPFEDYDRMVAEGLGPMCLAAVQKGTQILEQNLADATQFSAMAQLFNAGDTTDGRDVLSVPADAADGAVQYGLQSRFCADVLSSDPLHGLAKAAHDLAASPVLSDAESDGVSWQYQMCTQFGGFIIPYHDPALRVQSALLDLDYEQHWCQTLFGISPPPPTDQTNSDFYEALLNSKTTNIVFVNGAMDPYSTLSINARNGNAVNPNTESDLIDGGSHCIDFESFLLSGNPLEDAINAFQSRFIAIAKNWLNPLGRKR